MEGLKQTLVRVGMNLGQCKEWTQVEVRGAWSEGRREAELLVGVGRDWTLFR
jgi:hypothetical protein